MTPEAQAFLDALTLFFNDDVMVQLVQIFSFALGGMTGIAFVLASSMRWH